MDVRRGWGYAVGMVALAVVVFLVALLSGCAEDKSSASVSPHARVSGGHGESTSGWIRVVSISQKNQVSWCRSVGDVELVPGPYERQILVADVGEVRVLHLDALSFKRFQFMAPGPCYHYRGAVYAVALP